MNVNNQVNLLAKYIVLILKGVLVGFGAIMPGISGGTLCVAFGMYSILLDALSHPGRTFRNHGGEILSFLLGAAIGFVGLSGVAGWLMKINAQAVTCVFIGFILGTIPELWRYAGEKGRNGKSYTALVIGFILMITTLILLRSVNSITLSPGIGSFIICGIVWGISFIVPGLSSSTLLLFFGLYQPMLEGIAKFSVSVLLPLLIGIAICLIVLPKAVKKLYSRWYSVVSHIVLGIVIASTVSIFPADTLFSLRNFIITAVCIVSGAFISYFAGKACSRLESNKKAH